jgi:hypothetical protein
VPTIFLGSGASIATGIELELQNNFPSMSYLAKQYFENIEPNDQWGQGDITFWDNFKKEIGDLNKDWNKFNLEKFLLDYPLNERSALLSELLEITISAFHIPQKELEKKIVFNPEVEFSLRKLFEQLLKFLDKRRPFIEVISPNYDLIIEYTADLLGVPCLTGFHGSILRKWKPELGFSNPLIERNQNKDYAKHIRYYKPHGSYSWFMNEAGFVMEYFSDKNVPNEWLRCMIAPGPSKYQNTLKDIRRDHLKLMDDAFDRSQSIIVIGYGLNDPHLQEGLKKCLNRKVPILIVTKELSEEAKDEFITNKKNVFAILEDGNGSVVMNGGKEFQFKEQYWKLSELNAKLIN